MVYEMEHIRAQYSYPGDGKGERSINSLVDDLRGAVVTALGLNDSCNHVMPGHLEVTSRQVGRDAAGRHLMDVVIPAEVFCSGIGSATMSILVANAMELKGLRLEDVELPEGFLATSPGPKLGIHGVRELLRKPSGPLFAVALKPNLGMKWEDKAEIADRLAAGGVDIIKDDEMSLACPEGIIEGAAMIQARLDKYASDYFRPCYVPNVSGDLITQRHIIQLQAAGLHGLMMAFLICGWGKAFQVRSDERTASFLYGHRAGYEAILPFVSMSVIAKLTRLTGFDIVHVGTPQPGQDSKIADTRRAVVALRGRLSTLKPALPVFSKTTAELGRWLLDIFGPDSILMACGSLYGTGNLEGAARKWIAQVKVS